MEEKNELEQTPKKQDTEREETWQKQHEDREAEREAIRDRHRKIREYDGVIYRHAKPTPSPMDDEDKDVAVYARVSTKSLNQTSSIENQERYYKDKVDKTPNWSLQEVYSDEGKSGTSTKHRDAFNKMMKDAREGKFDMIICASVSRFARNVSDCIDYVTELRTMNPTKPIGVYFETENIFTLNKDADQTLGFHALLADWESGNKSRRMILSYDQRIFTNQFPVNDMLGYRHTKDGDLVIVPEEAKTVRFVFLSYMAGYDSSEIAEILTEKQRPTLKGRVEWNAAMVSNILENERRWGDLEARKTVVLDYKKKKIAKNNGIREGAFVPNHHEGIVSPAIARAAIFMRGTRGRLDCVPELTVIDRGTLKGFASINPKWMGIDHRTFVDACESVYSDEELKEIRHEAGILFGEEHSKILSLDFQGYEVPYGVFFLNRSMPAVTISKTRLTFSHACLKVWKDCDAVELLYHPILKTLVVRPCNATNMNAVSLVGKKDKGPFAFSARSFCKAIFDEMNWNYELQFKFRGITKIRDNTPIMFFALDEPRIMNVNGRNKKDSDEEPDSIKQFVDYKRGTEEESVSASGAYPILWEKGNHGLSLALRQRRDMIMSRVSGDDIRQSGIVVTNPLVGTIPTLKDVELELQELLESM